MNYRQHFATALVALMITSNIQAQCDFSCANSPLAQASALGALGGACIGLLRLLQHYRQEYEDGCEVYTAKGSSCKYYLTILTLHVLSGAVGSTVLHHSAVEFISPFWGGLLCAWFFIERPKGSRDAPAITIHVQE